MLTFTLRRIAYTIPIMLGVSLVCFALVHISPGDPLISILPPDASVELQEQLMAIYGFDRSYPEQFLRWLGRALQGDLGNSIATGRPVTSEVLNAVGNTLILAVTATIIGFTLGGLFGFVAGFFRDSWIDKLASTLGRWGSRCRITGWAWCSSSSSRWNWAGSPPRARAPAGPANGPGTGSTCATSSCPPSPCR
jgi:ABC-type dipeptide/oligopeptide/nickel transport system permease component